MVRLLDIVIATILLVLFLPVGLVLAIVLRLTGEGEIFYRQTRVGQGGDEFRLLKFATMLKDSPAMGAGDITVKNDPRVLPLGKFLRKTKLNEVPQLVNVLVGDMSLVGPRPQTPKNFEFFPKEARRTITSMKPGVTGIGSIVFRDEEAITSSFDQPMETVYREIIGPYKAELEAWYSQHQTVSNYLLLIVMTVWVVLRPESRVYGRVWPSLPPPPEPLRHLRSRTS